MVISRDKFDICGEALAAFEVPTFGELVWLRFSEEAYAICVGKGGRSGIGGC